MRAVKCFLKTFLGKTEEQRVTQISPIITEIFCLSATQIKTCFPLKSTPVFLAVFVSLDLLGRSPPHIVQPLNLELFWSLNPHFYDTLRFGRPSWEATGKVAEGCPRSV